MTITDDLRDYATTLKDSTVDVLGKAVKLAIRYPKATAVLLPLAVIGTYSGDEGLSPLYNVKTGDEWGLNIGIYTHIKPGATFKGANLSLFTKNEGKIYGLNGNVLWCDNNGEIKGVNLSGIANAGGDGTVKGLEGALAYNESNEGGLVQIGAVNKINTGKDTAKHGILFNHKFGGKWRKVPTRGK